ncbi:MAG: hypothetical protein ACK5C5_01075 [Bacteroidota bacterium]|jgi:hypothetical protein
MRLKALVFMWMVGVPAVAFAQSDTSNSALFYQKLQRRAESKKLTFFLYKVFFNVPNEEDLDSLVKETRNYEGKFIRKVIIRTREPFGTSLSDSIEKSRSIFQKTANALHFRTRVKAIDNLLLFSEGQELDALELEETERLIRTSGFIRDVKIQVVDVNKDSVDVFVDTRDLWTFKTSATVSSSSTRWKFTGYNLFGMGHRMSNEFKWFNSNSNLLSPEWSGYYLIPSLAGSFASAKLDYQIIGENRSIGLFVDRPFITSFAEWAGGAHVTRYFKNETIRITASKSEPFKKEGFSYGGWIGRSIMLKKGETKEQRSTRIAVAGSISVDECSRLTTADQTTSELLATTKTYLISTGYSNRKYIEDQYIFQFGEQEDVPSGRKLQITSGFEQKSSGHRPYLGATLGIGGYVANQFFLAQQLDAGTFIKSGEYQDAMLRWRTFWYSPLIEVGEWKLRLFGEMNYAKYLNQTKYQPLNLQQDKLLPGYKYNSPEGLERLAANITLTIFNPVDWLGFRFTPLLYGAAGIIGDGVNPLSRSNLLGVWGLGLAISNKFLAQSDFKLVLAFFPNQTDSYRIGSISAWEYEFRDYEFSRPEVVF